MPAHCCCYHFIWYGHRLSGHTSSYSLGVPEDIKTYVQETGRAGRDGLPSCALIMYRKSDISKTRTSEQMRGYCINATKLCCKVALFSDFDGCDDVIKEGGCQCCDICRKECIFTTCQRSVDNFLFWMLTTKINIIGFYQSLTLGAHAHEGYSTLSVCLFVCLFACYQSPGFYSRLYNKLEIPAGSSLVFLGFQLSHFFSALFMVIL